MPVHDEIDRPGRVVQQPLAEVDERRGVRVSLIDSEPQRAFRGHRGDHVHRIPGPGVLHLRGLADRRPGGAGVVVRADPGLISEPDRGSLRLGLRPDGRVLLVLPPLRPPRDSADKRGAAAAAATCRACAEAARR